MLTFVSGFDSAHRRRRNRDCPAQQRVILDGGGLARADRGRGVVRARLPPVRHVDADLGAGVETPPSVPDVLHFQILFPFHS